MSDTDRIASLEQKVKQMMDLLYSQKYKTTPKVTDPSPSEGLKKLVETSKDMRITDLENQLRIVTEFAQLMNELQSRGEV